MRLIIATGIYPPDIGGPATYSKGIAGELGRRGWYVKIITYADKIHPLTRGEVIRISRKRNVVMRYFLYTRELTKLAKKADLIYAQGPVSEGLPAYLASKITGKKYVLKVVGDPAWERFLSRKQENKKTKKQEKAENINSEDGKFVDLEKFQGMRGLPLKIKILRWIERLVSKNAEKIITPSEYLKKIVMMWGADFEKIQVIYNSIDDTKDEISVNKEEIRNLGGDIILSAGRLAPWKGFGVLIDIMPKLLAVNPNFKLVIVGDGPEYGNLVSSIKYQVSSKREETTNKEIKKLEISLPAQAGNWKLYNDVSIEKKLF